MNRRIHILVLGLCVLTIVSLSSCITVMPPSEPAPATTPAPVSPEPSKSSEPEPVRPTTPTKPAPTESSSMPDSLEDLTLQDIRDQITFLEWPTEARIGEYITVRLRIGSNEFWIWIRQELTDREEYDSIWLNPYYSLYLMPAKGLIPCAVIGWAEPDENHEVCWYGPIPASAEGEPIEPGTWKLIVEIGDPLGSVDAIVERNIIIKH